MIDLVLLSAMLGAFWRAEVEWRGWYGLIWTTYFHWAVPVGVAAFLLWLMQTPVVRTTGRRWGLLGLATLHATVTVTLTNVLLFECFGRFSPFRHLAAWILVGELVVTPSVAWGLGRLLGHRLPQWTLAASTLLLMASPVLATTVLSTIDLLHADAIHAVKTGMIIPFVVFALGLPWAVAEPDLEPHGGDEQRPR